MTDSLIDLYALFELAPTAKTDDIRAAYRRRAAEVHPDHQPPEKRDWASEEMKRLNAARDLLLDPLRRADYDKLWRANAWRTAQAANPATFAAIEAEYELQVRRYYTRRMWRMVWWFLPLAALLGLAFISLVVGAGSIDSVGETVGRAYVVGRTIVGFSAAFIVPIFFSALLALLAMGGSFWKS